jgi:hypothetical protein
MNVQVSTQAGGSSVANVTITLTLDEANLLFEALQEQPQIVDGGAREGPLSLLLRKLNLLFQGRFS